MKWIVPIHDSIFRASELRMLKKVQFEGHGRPQRSDERGERFEALAGAGMGQFCMNLPFEVGDLAADHAVGTEQLAGEKNRIGNSQFFGIVIRFPSQHGVGGVLELEISEETGFEHAINAGAELRKVLFEAPALDFLNGLGRECGMFDHGAKAIRTAIEEVLV